GARIYLRNNPECYTCREVGFNGTCNNIYRWTLGCNNKVDTNGTCKLCQTSNGGFHFFACCHNKVGKLIYNKHDIRQILMSLFRVKPACGKFFVVLFYVAYLCIFKQVVTLVHFNTKRVECMNYAL